MARLAGKVALISGGARGQGAAETRLFVREGAAVVFGDMLDDDGKKLEAEIRATGGQATYVHLNVTQEVDWRAAPAPAGQTQGKPGRPGDKARPPFPAKNEDNTRSAPGPTIAGHPQRPCLVSKSAIPPTR